MQPSRDQPPDFELGSYLAFTLPREPLTELTPLDASDTDRDAFLEGWGVDSGVRRQTSDIARRLAQQLPDESFGHFDETDDAEH